ncbi:hypothetical protein EYE35_01270 [Cereibacter sphaeroides]|nr:hypothetical protein EYE35_01270 [Cereibacter sphaeroides]
METPKPTTAGGNAAGLKDNCTAGCATPWATRRRDETFRRSLFFMVLSERQRRRRAEFWLDLWAVAALVGLLALAAWVATGLIGDGAGAGAGVALAGWP